YFGRGGDGHKNYAISCQTTRSKITIYIAYRRWYGSALKDADGLMATLKKQVMLVDDHPLMRHGMVMLINMEPDLQVSLEANDGNEALALLKKNEHIDIVLLDITLKTISGFEVIKSIHAIIPKLPVLFVSMHDENVY